MCGMYSQVIISLYCNDCSVSRAVDCVCKQIGLEVLFLDSTLSWTTGTSGVEFWCSTRKIIAVSRASYETIVGEELCHDEDDVRPPSKRSKSWRISKC